MLGIESYGSCIWHAVIVETYRFFRNRKECKTQAQYEVIVADDIEIMNNEKEKLMCNMKAMRFI